MYLSTYKKTINKIIAAPYVSAPLYTKTPNHYVLKQFSIREQRHWILLILLIVKGWSDEPMWNAKFPKLKNPNEKLDLVQSSLLIKKSKNNFWSD